MAQFIRSIDDIVGHKSIINYLKTKIDTDKVPNVLLFVGAAGLGKTSIAKVLAIAVNGNKPSLYESVIDKNESCDCIKLYDMSCVGDETDSIVAELQNTSFSSTGRKVLILDEVHGMTKKAQDAILVTLEYLPKNIYVFMCTTDSSSLREALESRCIKFTLNNLSNNEIKQIIKQKIKERGLCFTMSENMLYSTIAIWSNNQPRKAINLIEAFEEGSTVTDKDLSAFVTLNNVAIVISIIQYLYGSLTKGIEFISTLSISRELLSSLLEVLKVVLGGTSSSISYEDSVVINRIFADGSNNPENFLKFAVSVNSRETISNRVFTAKFIECHSSILNHGVRDYSVSQSKEETYTGDMRTIGDSAIEKLKQEATELDAFDRELENISSIEMLFDMGKSVE